jgi:single-strand DNA-binding protein
MYQRLVIVGNLGGDPEMRYTPDGTPVTNFSVATNRKWNNPDGSQGEETVWFRVTVWLKQAETCNQYLSKGRQVLVEGRLTPDKTTGGPRVWTGNDGKPRASFEMTADTVRFLSGGPRGEGGEPGTSYQEAPPPDLGESDIPF